MKVTTLIVLRQHTDNAGYSRGIGLCDGRGGRASWPLRPSLGVGMVNARDSYQTQWLFHKLRIDIHPRVS
jgi:hypothetical protein